MKYYYQRKKQLDTLGVKYIFNFATFNITLEYARKCNPDYTIFNIEKLA